MTGSLIILTGAGISADSGLATFRDADGMWSKFNWQDLATPEAFARDPQQVHAFYNARRAQLSDVAPNDAHRALAKLERDWMAAGGQFLLVTQNVDDLHERSGSKNLIHMHGELTKMRCVHCDYVDVAFEALSTDLPCLNCRRADVLRPDIVWFGEMPMQMDMIMEALESCTLFAAIGTSGTVYPAAGFADLARQAGARCVEINLDATDISTGFDECLTGRASDTVPNWAAGLCETTP